MYSPLLPSLCLIHRHRLCLLSLSLSQLLRSLPHIRFARHDAICGRGCCSCVSLSPVTATPKWFCFRHRGMRTLRQMSQPRHRRFAVDDPPATSLDFSSRARRTAVVTRFTDAKAIPRFRSVRVACTPNGCGRACSFARVEIELLRNLDFLVALSHPACMSLAAMHVLARSSSCAGCGRQPAAAKGDHGWGCC